MKRFVVIGLGNFGSSVAEALHRMRHDVVAIDMSESAVDRIAPYVARAAVGDARDRRTLERVGAAKADAGVVSTGDDITASILATLALRDIGVREVYVKVVSDDHARVMEKIGVTETIFPERESGIRLATRIMSTAILNFVRIGPGFSVQEIAVPESWIGRSLRELALPKNHRVSVVAVHDFLRDEMVGIPDPDSRLKDSDTLVVAGMDADLEKAARVR